jgi:hypothetical protein
VNSWTIQKFVDRINRLEMEIPNQVPSSAIEILDTMGKFYGFLPLWLWPISHWIVAAETYRALLASEARPVPVAVVGGHVVNRYSEVVHRWARHTFCAIMRERKLLINLEARMAYHKWAPRCHAFLWCSPEEGTEAITELVNGLLPARTAWERIDADE